MDLFKKFLELYLDVFKEYPLAAAATTALFIGVFLVWKKCQKTRPAAFWQGPGFVVCACWLILTPFLGFITKVLEKAVEFLEAVGGAALKVYNNNPAAASIMLVVLVLIYFAWRWALKKWPAKFNFWFQFPLASVILLWFVLSPVLGLFIGTSAELKEGKGEKPKVTKEAMAAATTPNPLLTNAFTTKTNHQ